MTRYVAFLRAINVGGRVVTMDRLRAVFVDLGFREVSTFIASGNVVFDARAAAVPALERRIERALEEALGYEVATFLRTPGEVTAVARYRPFDPAVMARATGLYVGFLAEPPGAEGLKALAALRAPTDRFHVHGRELYWLREGKPGESKIENGILERTVKARATFRGINTVVRLDAKLSAPAVAPPAGSGAGGRSKPARRAR